MADLDELLKIGGERIPFGENTFRSDHLSDFRAARKYLLDSINYKIPVWADRLVEMSQPTESHLVTVQLGCGLKTILPVDEKGSITSLHVLEPKMEVIGPSQGNIVYNWRKRRILRRRLNEDVGWSPLEKRQITLSGKDLLDGYTIMTAGWDGGYFGTIMFKSFKEGNMVYRGEYGVKLDRDTPDKAMGVWIKYDIIDNYELLRASVKMRIDDRLDGLSPRLHVVGSKGLTVRRGEKETAPTMTDRFTRSEEGEINGRPYAPTPTLTLEAVFDADGKVVESSIQTYDRGDNVSIPASPIHQVAPVLLFGERYKLGSSVDFVETMKQLVLASQQANVKNLVNFEPVVFR